MKRDRTKKKEQGWDYLFRRMDLETKGTDPSTQEQRKYVGYHGVMSRVRRLIVVDHLPTVLVP